jgi:glycosyltransferase involved in cell wall biosynthesis
VKEAGPLVFLEAIASGCFPLGTYFGGMAASIDSVSNVIKAKDVDKMKIDSNEEGTVKDLANNVPEALKICNKYKSELREVAVQQYDWQNVAKKFANNLRELSQ